MKKILTLTMSLLIAAGALAGCGTDAEKNSSTAETTAADADSTEAAETTKAAEAVDPGPFDLKVWGAQEDQEMLATMCENFKAANPDVTYNITFGVVSEADAKSEVLKDPSVAADVFAFSSDQLTELVNAGALYRVTKNKDTIVAENSDASLTAATVDGELYAYPSSSETYFMYYDKSKYTEDEVKSLDTMMAKDLGKTADGTDVKNFGFDIDNGWYSCAFFFAGGCTLFGDDGMDDTQCEFNNASGLAVGNYMLDLTKNTKFVNYKDDDALKALFNNSGIGAAVSGAWNAADMQTYLGDNYAATKLPTINLDGKDCQLGSMANFKLYGVNSSTKAPVAAMDLAEFLTNKDSQELRFETRSFAPTNKELAADTEALSSDVAVSASALQGQHSALQSPLLTDSYWKSAEAFGAELIDGTITKDNMQEKLDTYVENILTKLS